MPAQRYDQLRAEQVSAIGVIIATSVLPLLLFQAYHHLKPAAAEWRPEAVAACASLAESLEKTASITTAALDIAIRDPTIANTMRLATPDQILWFDNVSSRPVRGVNVQFYQPGGDFFLDVDDRFIQTDSYIAQYDAAAAVQRAYQGGFLNGPSFVRDFDRLGRSGEQGAASEIPDDGSIWYFPVDDFDASRRDERAPGEQDRPRPGGQSRRPRRSERL
ncbi:MAG TPA: hypothetical protein VKV96_10615 [Roseiarcus sp.]|nr:hypothetical protein [Roseiarcus sp.]